MMDRNLPAPEAKSANGELSDAFGEFMNSFEAFREANDQRLDQIERRFGEDVVTTEKVDRISQALDEQKRAMDQLVLKRARPALGRDVTLHDIEHKEAFEAYVRRGDERALQTIDQKAMSIGSGPDGGYLVPAETETAIGRRLAALSPIRSIASVRQVSASVLKKPFLRTGPVSGWVAETAARTQTNSPLLDELQFTAMELYAMPAATATLLEDSVVDLDEWIASEVEAAFAEQEGKAFVNGDGAGKPKGFLDYPSIAETSWTWGSLGYVATGVDGAFAASAAPDVLIEAVYALKSGYRQNANWVMNRKVQAAVRKLKDDDGNYIWQPPSTVGERAMLM